MASATWDDFTSKWGFHEGGRLKAQDFEARSTLVTMINDHPAMQVAQLRAVEYDRPGLHNPCMIVVLPTRGQPDDELLRLWFEQEISNEGLPGDVEIDDLIAAAYSD